MNSNVKIIKNSIVIKSSKKFFILFSILGFIFLISGLYLMNKIFPTGHILFAFGLLFASGGFFFFVNSKFIKILINEEPGYISMMESSNRTISPIRIPIKYYTKINIITNINPSTKSATTDATFKIQLENSNGASLFLTEFSSMEKATNFGKELQDILRIDLDINHNPLNNIIEEKVSRKYKPNIPLMPESKITITNTKKGQLYSWKNKNNLPSILSIIAILYGFFHVIFFVLSKELKNPIVIGLVYSIYSIIAILFMFTLIYNMLTTSHLYTNKNKLIYYKTLFKKELHKKIINKNDIGMVNNSLNASDETITIISKEGLSTLNKIWDKVNNEEKTVIDFSIVSNFFKYKEETISIDASNLCISEKFFIENAILKR